MMRSLAFVAVLLACTARGLTIQILVDDNATSRTRFCVGERLTLICNGNIGAYVWRIPPLITGTQLTVTTGVMIATVNNFTAAFISITESRLQFNVSPELNDTTITCFDIIRNMDLSTITLLLHDMSAPNITAVGTKSFTSVDISINNPSQCTQQYDVSITLSNEGSQVSSASVLNLVNGRIINLQSFVLGASTLDLCSLRYNIEVTATYIEGSGSSGLIPLRLPLEGIGFLNLSISKNNIYFSPSNQIFSNCISGYNLVFANQILQLGRDATNVSLNTFNIRNCSDAILTVIPLILGEEISSTSICICQPSDIVPLTTETTQQQATTQCQYQAYVGGIIGISTVAMVVVLILLIIITALVIKVKKYQLQLQDVSKPDAKNVDAQYDEVTLEMNQNKHKFITKSDHNSKGKSEMNMVDCLAYGTVSEISKHHGTSISETGTGVYEAI